MNKDILPGKNRDLVTDAYGRESLNLCNISGLIIANGRVNNGDFTFHMVSVESMDLLLSYTDLQNIKEFTILEQNEFSDHSPLSFRILGKRQVIFFVT